MVYLIKVMISDNEREGNNWTTVYYGVWEVSGAEEAREDKRRACLVGHWACIRVFEFGAERRREDLPGRQRFLHVCLCTRETTALVFAPAIKLECVFKFIEVVGCTSGMLHVVEKYRHFRFFQSIKCTIT